MSGFLPYLSKQFYSSNNMFIRGRLWSASCLSVGQASKTVSYKWPVEVLTVQTVIKFNQTKFTYFKCNQILAGYQDQSELINSEIQFRTIYKHQFKFLFLLIRALCGVTLCRNRA